MVSTAFLPAPMCTSSPCASTLLLHMLWLFCTIPEDVADSPFSEACIRGHRATRCEHFDRWMVRVKKPGRPLRDCPHATGPCTCHGERVIMLRIPKSDQRQMLLAPIGTFLWNCSKVGQPRIKANNAQKGTAIVAKRNLRIQLRTMLQVCLLGSNHGNRIRRAHRE